MSRIKIKLIAILFSITLSFSGGYQVANWKHNTTELIELKKQVEADREMREKLFNISTETLEKTKNIKIENKTIYKATEREILKEPVYTDCVLTEEGFRLLNEGRK